MIYSWCPISQHLSCLRETCLIACLQSHTQFTERDLHRLADCIIVFQWAYVYIEFWHVVLTIPMKAPFNVLVKLHLGVPFRPNLVTNMTVILPPDPPITVLLITRAITSPSPGFVMVPTVPPLNDRNPTIRIMPPRPVSCRDINYVNNDKRPKRKRKKLKYSSFQTFAVFSVSCVFFWVY